MPIVFFLLGCIISLIKKNRVGLVIKFSVNSNTFRGKNDEDKVTVNIITSLVEQQYPLYIFGKYFILESI